jgi:hypothetical protein
MLSACLLFAPAAGAELFETSNGAASFDSYSYEPEFGEPSLPSPFAEGCGRTVGLLGSPFADTATFIEDNGLTVTMLDASAIAGGALASVDVLYVVRSGMTQAQAEAATIDAWIQDGGVMMTEFTSTTLFFEPGPLNYLTGSPVATFHVPSGTVCGGNTVVINDPGNPLAEGLPAAWDCSGDPIGVLYVYDSVDPELCVIASVAGSDANGDGVPDPLVGVRDVGDGAIIAFFSDFGDWQVLEDPRDCSGGPSSATCMRSAEDETLMLNALCRVGASGGSVCASGCSDCDALHETIDSMEIDVEGVRNSFHVKADAACKALDKGKLNTAGNILCASLNHDRAQFAKHVSKESAIAYEDCVRAFADANSIPLDSGRCGSVLED